MISPVPFFGEVIKRFFLHEHESQAKVEICEILAMRLVMKTNED